MGEKGGKKEVSMERERNVFLQSKNLPIIRSG